MGQMLPPQVEAYTKRHRRHQAWQKIVSTLACIVVFCTTYALILPAITQEKDTFCGLEAHTHDDSCYTQSTGQTQSVLACSLQSLGVHTHSAECYDADGRVICGQADYVVHTHDDHCYDAAGNLVCALPERSQHVHTDGCYTTQGGHTHDDHCYTITRGALTCTLPEEEGHTHGESCYGPGDRLTCAVPENHVHSDACYTTTLTCTLAEDENHTHSESCYSQVLTCTLPEGHVHSSACYEQVLQCTLEESQGHTHTDQCYEQLKTLTCTLEETSGEQVLVCTEPTASVHVHSEACFQTVTEQTLTCGLTEGEGHTHTARCYGTWTLTCGKEEHTHTESCYIDLTADLETAADWEQTFANVELTGVWTDDVLAIAKTQLGYHESTVNYVITDSGNKGYSRYGAWYGDPYGDWCAMYVAFCLHYAQVEGMPVHSNCVSWIEALTAEDLYVSAEGYTPAPGDVIFFEYDSDSRADHVGLVLEVDAEKGTITTIEGNSANQVRTVTYDLSDSGIFGYGLLPAQLSEEEQAEVALVISLIDTMPSADEIDAKIQEFEAAEDYEGEEAWLTDTYQQVAYVYYRYDSLTQAQKEHVTNADKLLELEYIWSAVTLAVTDSIEITSVNAYHYESGNNALIVHSDSGTTIGNSGMSETAFAWWYAIVVEAKDGQMVVTEIHLPGEGLSKSDVYASGTGFILLYYPSGLGKVLDVSVGDYVSLSSTFWKTTSIYSGTAYGTVIFQDTPVLAKAEKDNTSKLHIVDSADTSEFIELNLYNYGDNINDLWQSDRKYPGFQQDYGTITVYGTDTSNFGNNITSNLAAGEASLTNQGGTINSTWDSSDKSNVNGPISGAMKLTLQDGYPALSDGTSLDYLFSNSAYATKANTNSINGLFRYNSQTGAYTYNSRINHAQFNADSDTFTLYREIITSNFTMYPFGNFLPFNDITKLSAQLKTIDRAYLLEIADSAQFKANNNAGDEYATLASAMNTWISLMDAEYPNGWDADEAIEEYFNYKPVTGSTIDFDDTINAAYQAETGLSLWDSLYSIDYDEETDFFFSMEMKMNLTQAKDGLTGLTGQEPMEFYFTGDDDVWVYIDNALFLDLSGIHRHVGGKIDFVSGKIYYYSLDAATGDVSTTPYATVTFEEAFRAAFEEGSTELTNALASLNEKGTFKDYTTHVFHFYYMERGSGSGVCRLNFNFPLLRQHSISVSKEVASDTELLGNPDYKFQILKADSDGNKTSELFIAASTEYTIYDESDNVIGTGTTDANGVFTLKAGQRAEFDNIDEDAGKYYVRELLDGTVLEQYSEVTVSGEATTTSGNITIGSDTFTGMDSPVKDMSDGATAFRFTNNVDDEKLGSLSISKKLTEYPKTRDIQAFDIQVTLDGEPLPVGTAYTVGEETRTVTTEGIITIAADETALLSNILAGTQFTVQETSGSAEGYIVTYTENGGYSVEVQDGVVTGVIKTSAKVQLVVTNSEAGAAVTIPGTKSMVRYDGTERTYTFRLTEVTDSTGAEEKADGLKDYTATVAVQDGPVDFSFTLTYIQAELDSLPQAFYYRITEDSAEGVLPNDTVYVAEVTVCETDDGIAATLTGMWKDGTKVETFSADFENTLVGDLTLSKTVAGDSEAMEQVFSFEITLSDPVDATYTATRIGSDESETVTFEQGVATVTLKHGQSLTIHDLPYGTGWTIRETDGDGYVVTYTVNGEFGEGTQASGSISPGITEVAFTNTATYSLPETGGTGTIPYTMAGLMLMLLSAAFLLYRSKKRRREAF